MATTITEQDAKILTKMQEVVPKLPPSSKDKLLTITETMAMLHEAQQRPITRTAVREAKA